MTGNRTQKVNAAGTVNYEYGSGNRISGWSFAATGAVEVYVDVHGHASEPIGTDPRWGERTVNELSVEVSGTNFWVSDVPLGAGTQELVAAISDEAGNVGRTTNTVVVKIATNGAYQFDSAGNVTNIAYAGLGTVGLAWDGWYMLKSVATNGATAESYTYDAYGRRVRIAKGTNTLCLVYDGPHCIAEVDTNGVPVRSYTYGPGIDNVLAMTVHQPDVRTYYYIKDHLGSVLALTDESGALVESYSYDAWGRVLGVYDGGGVEIAESSVGNRILWQGREYSWSTGLYYFRARWYDPITGRWLSNDPIGIAGGLNQYAFVGNNPVNAVDPLGLCNATRATNPQLQLIRAYIDATDIAAAVAWWVPKGGLLVGGAIALHGGPWAPLDLMTNAKVPTWTVDGQTMTSPQYGNYLAGYYAGYADSSGILFGMYYGGISWAIAGNAGAVFTGQPYGESVFDEQSVPYITAGFIAGSQDRDCQQQSCR